MHSFATILHDQMITGLLLTKEEEEVIYLILTQLCHNNFLSKLQSAAAAYLLAAKRLRKSLFFANFFQYSQACMFRAMPEKNLFCIVQTLLFFTKGMGT